MPYRSLPEAPLVVAAVRNKLTGYVAATGQVAWTYEAGSVSNNSATRMIVTDSHVFLLGGGLACVTYLTGQLVWKNDSAANDGSFILQDGRLFVGSRTGKISCYSASDGTLVWEAENEGYDLSAVGAPWNFSQGDRT